MSYYAHYVACNESVAQRQHLRKLFTLSSQLMLASWTSRDLKKCYISTACFTVQCQDHSDVSSVTMHCTRKFQLDCINCKIFIDAWHRRLTILCFLVKHSRDPSCTDLHHSQLFVQSSWLMPTLAAVQRSLTQWVSITNFSTACKFSSLTASAGHPHVPCITLKACPTLTKFCRPPLDWLIDIRLLLKAVRTQLYIRHNISTCK